MKAISIYISLVYVFLNTFYFTNESLANPTIKFNLIKQSNLQDFHGDISKAPNSMSKNNNLQAIQLKSLSYSNKVLKSNSNAISTKSEFKNTFKDASSSFSSNYGPIKRSSESTKHCSSKACYN